MKKTFAFLSFVIFCYQCEAIEVDCGYLRYALTLSAYICNVENQELITSKDYREISAVKVSDKYRNGKSDDDIKQFKVENKTAKFFPRGVTKFLRNVEVVWITQAGLEEVTKEDLRQFGRKLKDLYLHSNKIEKIDADLFDFNPNLEVIELRSNKIKQIAVEAFNSLKKLKTLSLDDNPCTDDDDWGFYERPKVLELIKGVETKC